MSKSRTPMQTVEGFLSFLVIEKYVSPLTVEGYRRDLRQFIQYLDTRDGSDSPSRLTALSKKLGQPTSPISVQGLSQLHGNGTIPTLRTDRGKTVRGIDGSAGAPRPWTSSRTMAP